jgi:uncharacterized protein (TIGR02594 family)
MMFIIGCVSLLAMSGSAFSQPLPEPKPKPQAAQQQHRGSVAHRATNPKPNWRAARLRSMPVTQEPKRPPLGWPALVSEARKYIGTNPTDRKRLWCATFMNMVLAKTGYSGTNSDAAKSFAQYGHRISVPKVGAIAVLTRGKRGGHVGVVTGIDANGNPIIISGNHGNRVGEAIYPRSRVIAYVMPSERQPGTTQLAARSAPSRSAPDTGLESPITELLAAIEAEQSHAERPRVVRPDNQRQEAARDERPQQPAVPHLTVQQVAGPDIAARRELPLEPGLAEFLGIKDRAQNAARPPLQSQRERRVELLGQPQSR